MCCVDRVTSYTHSPCESTTIFYIPLQWYSGTHAGPRSMPSMVPWLWSLLRGRWPGPDDLILGQNQAFSRLFVLSYVLLLMVLLMGGVIAVLIAAVHSVRLQLLYNSSIEDQDYDMGPFAWRQLKQWLGLAKPKPVRAFVFYSEYKDP